MGSHADRKTSEDPRISRSRVAILDAATAEFFERGFEATSLDDVAARARISRRTIYNIYKGKEHLFLDVVDLSLRRAESLAGEAVAAFEDPPGDVAVELETACRQILRVMQDEQVLLLRRSLLGVANRFPGLVSGFYRRVPQRVLDAVAGALARHAEAGAVAFEDVELAAEHLVYLVLGASPDRALFRVETPGGEEMERRAGLAASLFLRAYAP